MTEGIQYTGNEQTNKNSCCLKGCLIMLLALLILIPGCGAGTYFIGRNYINRNLPVWEERYPAVRITVGLFRLRKGIKEIFVYFGGNLERQEGADDITLLPVDIPIYPDPLVEACSIGEAQGFVYQRVEKEPDELQSYLRDAMQQNGWELANEHEITGGRMLSFNKGQRFCNIEVLEYEEGSEIWLRYSEPEPDE